MTQKSELGKYGEDMACEYLVKNSYRILERNHRKPWGELDIVARSNDGTLVFIEVKTLREYSGQAMRQYSTSTSLGINNSANNPAIAELTPEDQMSSAKLKKFKRAVEAYVFSHENLIEDAGYRCDLIALTIMEKDYRITHYKNL